MSDEKYWQLPNGINEVLPDEAEQLEQLSHDLLGHFKRWGYWQVMPPLLEFVESLYIGPGSHLDKQTFKVTDQISGKMMGIRADMTPQVARIDAHSLADQVLPNQPNRLCYIGHVLRSRSNNLLQSNRNPLQIGAELFGHAGLQSDSEIITLMLTVLRKQTEKPLLLSLGHIGIYQSIVEFAQLDELTSQQYRDKVTRKSLPEIEQWLNDSSNGFSVEQKQVLRLLPELVGLPDKVIKKARQFLAPIGLSVIEKLDYIEQLCEQLTLSDQSLSIYLDLSEIRGYAYHTGIIFEAYIVGECREIARGGRYDGIGKHYGNDRPATGFSADLHQLLALNNTLIDSNINFIFAPAVIDKALISMVESLRASGQYVIQGLGHETDEIISQLGCTRRLTKHKDTWVVETI